MIVSARVQSCVLVALALLMTATRGQHFASIDALPSASWAVFFLAGVLLRPLWVFGALFALASVLDVSAMQSGSIRDWCLSPAYWVLLPAYASLWGAGRLYARLHRERLQTLAPLAAYLALGALLAYSCSGGGFYFFSGHYQAPTLAGFGARVLEYYPRGLGALTLYVGIAAGLRALLRLRAAAPAPAPTVG